MSSNRWTALYVLCVGVLMIVLDATVVNVALPTIQEDLDFSQSDLAWVVNAYLIAFGGLLLLAGRLGDLIGHRRVFMWGLGIFTVASLLCGLAQSQEMLIAARFVQGGGGALASAVTLGMIVTMFPEPREQAKAIGVYGFVASARGGRPARRGARDGRPDAGRLHDPRRRGARLDLRADAHPRGRRDRADRRLRAAAGAHREAADAAAPVPLAERQRRQRGDGAARGRHVRHLLPGRALHAARAPLHAARGRTGVPARLAPHGADVARLHRPDQHALRAAQGPDHGARVPARGDAAVPPDAGG